MVSRRYPLCNGARIFYITGLCYKVICAYFTFNMQNNMATNLFLDKHNVPENSDIFPEVGQSVL